MASVGEIAAGVRTALNAVAAGRAQLAATLDQIQAVGEAYVRLGAGSSQPDMPAAAAAAQQAAEQLRRAVATLDQATAAAERYLATIVGSSPPTEQPRPGRQLDANQIDRLRGELPRPITAAERGTGRKTHGRWFGADGVVRSVVSGEDEWSMYGDDVFDRFGEPLLMIASHVEIKVGARLRAEYERTGRPQHATIVQNYEPCMGRKSCADLLPMMLPEGCSLTVHAPNYRRTFTGGKI